MRLTRRRGAITSEIIFQYDRRMRGTAPISARVSNSFMPIGVVRSRSSRFNPLTSSGQS